MDIDHICSKIVPKLVRDLSSSHRRTEDVFRYFFSGLLLSCVVWFGVIGNFGIMYLVYRKRVWSRVNYYLVNIAIWDNVLLLSAWPMYSLSVLMYRGKFPRLDSWAVITSLLHALANCAMTGCVWSTLTLTIERYIAVHHPLIHERRLNTPLRNRLILIFLSTITVAFALPRYFEVEVLTCPQSLAVSNSFRSTNESFTTIEAMTISSTRQTTEGQSLAAEIITNQYGFAASTAMFDTTNLISSTIAPPTPLGGTRIVVQTKMFFNYFYFTIYRVIGGLVFITVLPFALMTLLTVRIIIALKRASLTEHAVRFRFNGARGSMGGATAPGALPNTYRVDHTISCDRNCKAFRSDINKYSLDPDSSVVLQKNPEFKHTLKPNVNVVENDNQPPAFSRSGVLTDIHLKQAVTQRNYVTSESLLTINECESTETNETPQTKMTVDNHNCDNSSLLNNTNTVCSEKPTFYNWLGRFTQKKTKDPKEVKMVVIEIDHSLNIHSKMIYCQNGQTDLFSTPTIPEENEAEIIGGAPWKAAINELQTSWSTDDGEKDDSTEKQKIEAENEDMPKDQTLKNACTDDFKEDSDSIYNTEKDCNITNPNNIDTEADNETGRTKALTSNETRGVDMSNDDGYDPHCCCCTTSDLNHVKCGNLCKSPNFSRIKHFISQAKKLRHKEQGGDNTLNCTKEDMRVPNENDDLLNANCSTAINYNRQKISVRKSSNCNLSIDRDSFDQHKSSFGQPLKKQYVTNPNVPQSQKADGIHAFLCNKIKFAPPLVSDKIMQDNASPRNVIIQTSTNDTSACDATFLKVPPVSGCALSKNGGDKSTKKRRRKVRRSETIAINKIFVLVLVKFLSCYTLPTVIDLIEAILGRDNFRGAVLVYLIEISNFLVVSHSATNFLLHFIYGPKLYREMKKLFHRLIAKDEMNNEFNVLNFGALGGYDLSKLAGSSMQAVHGSVNPAPSFSTVALLQARSSNHLLTQLATGSYYGDPGY